MTSIRREAARECSRGRHPTEIVPQPDVRRAAAQANGKETVSGTYTNLLYHLVFSTKDRVPLISRGLQEDLYSYMGGIIRGEGGILLEVGGTSDHVHLLAKLKPTRSVSEMLNRIKAKSSKWINQERPKLRKFGWQDGYAALSVSESLAGAVKRYIRNQENHHRRKTFQDEFRALLDKHEIAYEERYLWV